MTYRCQSFKAYQDSVGLGNNLLMPGPNSIRSECTLKKILPPEQRFEKEKDECTSNFDAQRTAKITNLWDIDLHCGLDGQPGWTRRPNSPHSVARFQNGRIKTCQSMTHQHRPKMYLQQILLWVFIISSTTEKNHSSYKRPQPQAISHYINPPNQYHLKKHVAKPYHRL